MEEDFMTTAKLLLEERKTLAIKLKETKTAIIVNEEKITQLLLLVDKMESCPLRKKLASMLAQ